MYHWCRFSHAHLAKPRASDEEQIFPRHSVTECAFLDSLTFAVSRTADCRSDGSQINRRESIYKDQESSGTSFTLRSNNQTMVRFRWQIRRDMKLMVIHSILIWRDQVLGWFRCIDRDLVQIRIDIDGTKAFEQVRTTCWDGHLKSLAVKITAGHIGSNEHRTTERPRPVDECLNTQRHGS